MTTTSNATDSLERFGAPAKDAIALFRVRKHLPPPLRTAASFMAMWMLLCAAAPTDARGQVPGQPKRLVAEVDGENAILLFWDEPTDPGGSAITGYRIEVSTSPTSGWTNLVANTMSTNLDDEDSGLSAGSTRFYRVSAINSSGTGPPSEIAGATTDGATGTPPGAPAGLMATADGGNAIDLSWTAPSDTGSSNIVGYLIEFAFGTGTNFFGLAYSTTTSYKDIDLSVGETRNYRVVAMNNSGFGSPSQSASATTQTGTPPEAPTGLTATADGQNAIDLSWTAPSDTGSSNITGYQIEHSPDGASSNWTTLVANTSSTATTYKDGGLQPGTTVFYRVFAINDTGAGEASDTAAATTDVAVPPGPPTGLAAVEDGSSAIELSWAEPTDPGNSAINGYQVEVSSDGGSAWNIHVANTGSTTTSYRHTGLPPATTRHYRVAAINDAGPGAPSDTAAATTEEAAPGVPGAPTNLTATPDGETAIDLSWTAPTDTGTSAITGYRIEVSSDGGGSWSNLRANTRSTATTDTHSGLSPGSTRHYRVSAINGDGRGPVSQEASARTEDESGGSGTPAAPTGLVARAAGESAIDLSWTAPSDTGTSAIIGYQIQVSANGGTQWTDLASSATPGYTHGGLSPNTTRHYRVAAVNNAGRGRYSSTANATTDGPANASPGPPTNLRASPDGLTAILLAWTPPTDTGSSAITGYRIEVSGDGGSSWSDLQSDTRSTATTYRHSGLEAATTRHYRVSAINGAGTGPPSNVDGATTGAAVPDAPTGLVAAAQGTRRINLSWAAPADDGGSPLVGYRIEVSADGGGTWRDRVRNTNSTSTSYAHTGLSAASTRHYRVSAINSVGTGSSSNVAFATTDPVVPEPPTNLRARAISTSEIELSWRAPANDGGSSIVGYRIRGWAEDAPGWVTLVDNTGSTATVYLHEGLAPASTWRYQVMAINAAGAGAASNTDTATTAAAPPGPPREPAASPRGPHWIELTWRAPESAGGVAISGYQIEVYEEGSATWTVLESNTRTTVTLFHHLQLDPGTTWYYRISAINSVGTGEPSKVASATTDPVVPAKPTGLVATAEGPWQIDLEWAAPDYDGGAPVTGYLIEVFEGSGDWQILTGNTRSTSTNYAHTDLDPASTLTYRVTAINAAGAGSPSNMATATTDPVVPGPPTNLTVTANGTSRLDLSWAAPGYDGGARVSGYKIEVSDNRGATWATLVENTRSAATVFPHTGLRPATTRHYRVSAINRVGTGPPSGVDGATTDATVPDRPEQLLASAADHSQISLIWDAPAFNGGAPITGYRIEVSENAGVTWAELLATTGSNLTTYAHTGLSPATTWHYRVSASGCTRNLALNVTRGSSECHLVFDCPIIR